MYSIKKRQELVNEFGEWADKRNGEYGFILGEYSFADYEKDEETGEFYQNEFFYEDLRSYALAALKERSVMDKLLDVTPEQVIEDICFDQPSSKSGVLVYLKHNIDIDQYLNLSTEYDENEVINEAYKNMQAEKKALDRAIEIVQPIIENAAEGIRSGVFSNGEVVFRPIGQGKAKNWETFTSKYNPNNGFA